MPRGTHDGRIVFSGRAQAFWDSGEPEQFELSGDGGDRLDYLRARQRRGAQVFALHGRSRWAIETPDRAPPGASRNPISG